MFDEEAIQAYMTAFGMTREEAIATLSAAAGIAGISMGSNDVFFGETKTTQKKQTRGAAKKTITNVKVDKKSKEDSYGLFWEDESIQNRVLSYLQLIGRAEGGRPAAYEVWKDVVDQAAEIYRGGKGAKITPYELLNMSMQGASATGVDITRQIRKYDEDVLKEVANSIAMKKQGAMLSDEEMQEALALANSMIEKGTVTKTEKVRNPKTGKIETVVKTSPGFSQERFESELGKKIEEDSPERVERRKMFEFTDLFDRIVAGGM